jgi:hypothetical protein
LQGCGLTKSISFYHYHGKNEFKKVTLNSEMCDGHRHSWSETESLGCNPEDERKIKQKISSYINTHV